MLTVRFAVWRRGLYKFDEQSSSRGILGSRLSQVPLDRGGADCPRAHTTLFLMVLYLKVHVWALPFRNPDVRMTHFLVPVLTLEIMAKFVAIRWLIRTMDLLITESGI